MNKAIRFTKDGQERYVSNLREFIKLIYNDNQKINDRNLSKLFEFANLQERNNKIISDTLSNHAGHISRLLKRRNTKFVAIGTVLGIWGWYRSYKLEKRIEELEKEIIKLMEEAEDDLIFDFDMETKPKEE